MKSIRYEIDSMLDSLQVKGDYYGMRVVRAVLNGYTREKS